MSRVKGPKKIHTDTLHHKEEDVRFGTPQVVAEYRAERLKCEVIADLGCGAGFQSVAFAKTCGRVLAVEKDERKLEYAKKNALSLGLSNITFIHGDALDPKVIEQLKECQIVFCDTERLPSESARTLDTVQPDPRLIVAAYSSTITPELSIEIPPHLMEIPFPCEREYLSLNGKLNRLTLYLGKLKKSERSVVLLPEKQRLQSTGKEASLAAGPSEASYLYEVNPAVTLAKLYAELDYTFFMHADKPYGFSAELKPSLFLRAYRILASCPCNPMTIQQQLRGLHAGKVLLRYKIDPQAYWKERKQYEQGLSGERKIHLFFFDQAYLCEEIYSE